MSLKDDIIKLTTLLSESEQLLRSHEVQHWPDWLDKIKKLLTAKDFSGVTMLLEGFGGMGSFNDVYIAPINGHTIGENAVLQTNAKLRELSSKIYEIASKLKRDHEE